MSDMQKWITLCESHRPGGQVVQISQNKGGGLGKFVKYSESGTSAMVDVKGDVREYAVEDLTDPIEGYYEEELEKSNQRYGEIEGGNHYLPDKPELQPGQTVEVNNIYGSGNGAGYGQFVAYSLDGTSAIVNFDGSDRSVPIDAIKKAPEETSEENFASTGNDGSMSPMSTAGDNVDEIRIGESKMDEFEKWLNVCEAADEDKEVEVEEVDEAEETVEEEDEEQLEEGVCGCNSHTCLTCFPSIGETVKENEIFDEVFDIMEMDDEDLDDDLEEGNCPTTRPRTAGSGAAGYYDDANAGGDGGGIGENPELDAIPDEQSGPMDPNMGQGMLPVGEVPGGPEAEVMVVSPDGAGLEEPCCDGDPRLDGEPEIGGAPDAGPDSEVMDLLARLNDILGNGGGGFAEIPTIGGAPETTVEPEGDEVILQMGESEDEEDEAIEEKKADKDYDKDGKIEDESDEHAGAVDNAIKAEVEESGKPWEDDDKEEVDENEEQDLEDEEGALEEGQIDPVVAEWLARLR